MDSMADVPFKEASEISVMGVEHNQTPDHFCEVSIRLVITRDDVLNDLPQKGFGTPSPLEIARWLIAHSNAKPLEAAAEIAETKEHTP